MPSPHAIQISNEITSKLREMDRRFRSEAIAAINQLAELINSEWPQLPGEPRMHADQSVMYVFGKKFSLTYEMQGTAIFMSDIFPSRQ